MHNCNAFPWRSSKAGIFKFNVFCIDSTLQWQGFLVRVYYQPWTIVGKSLCICQVITDKTIRVLHNRDVNMAEIFGPARKFFGSVLPGPKSMYYKICKMVYKYYCILELYTLEK